MKHTRFVAGLAALLFAATGAVMPVNTISAISSVISAGAEEAELPASGKIGDNVTYTYDSSTEKLTLSGTGATYNYESHESPFDDVVISELVINEGITEIGDNLFPRRRTLYELHLPKGVKRIGKYAFCSKQCFVKWDKYSPIYQQ